jgi:hypothetical protein
VVLERRGDCGCRGRRVKSHGTEVLYVVFASLLAPLYEAIPFSSLSLAAAGIDRRLPTWDGALTPHQLA